MANIERRNEVYNILIQHLNTQPFEDYEVNLKSFWNQTLFVYQKLEHNVVIKYIPNNFKVTNNYANVASCI